MTSLSNFCIALVTYFSLITPSLSQQRGTPLEEAKKTKAANLVYVYESVTSTKELQSGLIHQDETGKEVGVLVDMVKAFERYVTEKYEIRITSRFVNPQNTFQGFLDEVKNGSGGIFGLSSVSITDERKEIMQFSPSYLNSIMVLISSKNVATLSDTENIANEFENKSAVAVSSAFDHKILSQIKKENYPSLKINLVNSPVEVLSQVASNEQLFGYADFLLYLKFVSKGNPIRRHPTGDLLSDKYGIIMPLSSDWGPVLTEFLNSGYLESSEYRRSIIKYIGKEALRML